MMDVPTKSDDNVIYGRDDWEVRLIGPELIEYRCADAACLVNVAYSPVRKAREVYASESSSDLFPELFEHLRMAMRRLPGAYVVV